MLTPLNPQKTPTKQNHSEFLLFEENLLACFFVAEGPKCSVYVPTDPVQLFDGELEDLAILCSHWFEGQGV